MTYSDTPEIILAHPGSVMVEIHTYENPEPHDKRVERPIVAWELEYDNDFRQWLLRPWVMLGFSAERWDLPAGVEDYEVELHQTPVAAPHVVERYKILDDGTWQAIKEEGTGEAVAI